MSLPLYSGSMYDPTMTAPMRAELVQLGVESLETADAVDAVLGEKSGTVLVVVNSVCGCAAGNARPGVAAALQHRVKPDALPNHLAFRHREPHTDYVPLGVLHGPVRRHP